MPMPMRMRTDSRRLQYATVQDTLLPPALCGLFRPMNILRASSETLFVAVSRRTSVPSVCQRASGHIMAK
eukprot:2896260-Lingulodinium_polyedra.AAC.1